MLRLQDYVLCNGNLEYILINMFDEQKTDTRFNSIRHIINHRSTCINSPSECREHHRMCIREMINNNEDTKKIIDLIHYFNYPDMEEYLYEKRGFVSSLCTKEETVSDKYDIPTYIA